MTYYTAHSPDGKYQQGCGILPALCYNLALAALPPTSCTSH
ncbi:MAG TPA: hypothetical protein VL334_13205 [Anaerolineae bacterium]|nr:hypothetical protein [Anaerolineae bacterium]